LPFRAIVAEQTNAILVTMDAVLLVEELQTNTKVLSALTNLCVVLPNISSVGLRLGVPWTVTEALVV
jgi:hypothetical protein